MTRLPRSLAGPAGASSSPSVAAATLANVVSVASAPSGTSVCAVLSTGRVDCWGDNQEGQLGDGTTTNSDVPVAVLAAS
jgi:alpha-tubulin suppressor-like RCC1 family protein